MTDETTKHLNQCKKCFKYCTRIEYHTCESIHVHSWKFEDVCKDWNGKGGYPCTVCGEIKK